MINRLTAQVLLQTEQHWLYHNLPAVKPGRRLFQKLYNYKRTSKSIIQAAKAIQSG